MDKLKQLFSQFDLAGMLNCFFVYSSFIDLIVMYGLVWHEFHSTIFKTIAGVAVLFC